MNTQAEPRAKAAAVAAPRWLDADEQRAWRAWLFSQVLLLERLDRDLTRQTGISHAYYEILVALSEAPGRTMRMSELAERCRSSRSRLSHAVARLEERGWVRRQVCDSDGRGQLAVLTDDGFEALEDAAPVHVESVRVHLFDQLTPTQIEAMGGIGESLLQHLDSPAPPLPPPPAEARSGAARREAPASGRAPVGRSCCRSLLQAITSGLFRHRTVRPERPRGTASPRRRARCRR